ncbi:MAG TPA: UDP-N-acetylmuramoyl-L-alanine--D-glutamate ligase [Candidatus Saccharimonadales bacterium]|nr:UDP-N-acetylmuramoyl-L-alanine--D-glutamate ligase [Candidatus Saccharimonadales bacterium]
MKIAILGYDVEGRASFDYFAAQDGHELTVCDRNPAVQVPEGVPSMLGEGYLDDLDRFDLLVRTPGLPPEAILEKNPGVANKVTSLINEFLKVCPTRNVIGVTGTKGKGTTSALIARMLQAAGKDVRLGGNIGVPPLQFLPELTAESWVVLELSSFQLVDLRASPHIGVCLMVVPEHLDWHPAMDHYAAAKSRLFAAQETGDVAIYFADNEESRRIAAAGHGRKLPYFAPPGACISDGTVVIEDETICRTDELRLLGKHNWQNVCAAVTAAWQVVQDVAALRSVLTSFSGLAHRLELVRELHGVRYYDDSFGTAPETAMVAIEAFEQPVIAILGGRSKGIPFDALAKFVAQRPNVKQVITIGETGPEIAALLRRRGFDRNRMREGGNTMDQIVRTAQELAEPGDVVLLSPACTSFDMFQNYKERGERFTEAVRALA